MKSKWLVIILCVSLFLIIGVVSKVFTSRVTGIPQLLYGVTKGKLIITVEAEGVIEPREVNQLTPNNMFKKGEVAGSGIEDKMMGVVSEVLRGHGAKSVYLSKGFKPPSSSKLPLTNFTIQRIVPKGTSVNQGDLLVEFDSQPLYDTIKQTEEQLETLNDNYEVRLDNLRTTRESLAIPVDKARLNLEQTLKDYNRLWEEAAAGKISEDSLEFQQRLLQAKKQRIDLENVESRYRIVDVILQEYDIKSGKMIEEGVRLKEIPKEMLSEITGIKLIKHDGKISQPISIEQLKGILNNLDEGITTGMLSERLLSELGEIKGIIPVAPDDSSFASGLRSFKSSVYYPERLKNERPEIVAEYLKPLVNLLEKIEDKQNHLAQLKQYPQPLALYAPISGYVFHGAHNQEQWSVREDDIKEGVRINLTQPVVFVSNSLEMKVTISVGENDIGKIKSGQQVRIKPNAYPGLALEGKVVEVSEVPMQQQGWRRHSARATGAKEQYSVIINLLGSDPRLRPRMNAQVDIFCETHEDVVFVPQEAVFKQDGSKICYLWLGNEPQERVIKTDKGNTDFVIITEGLQAGDKVYLYNPFLNQ